MADLELEKIKKIEESIKATNGNLKSRLTRLEKRDPAMLSKFEYPKIELDAYFSPPWTAEALADHENVAGLVWEPFVGNGALAGVYQDKGLDVIATDLRDYGFPQTWTLNFLRHNVEAFFLQISNKREPNWIISNPPYSGLIHYVEKCLAVSDTFKCSAALLLRNEWDCGKSRKHIFLDNPHYKKKIVLTTRPTWFNGGNVAPRHNYAWYVWDYAHEYKQKEITYSFRKPPKENGKETK